MKQEEGEREEVAVEECFGGRGRVARVTGVEPVGVEAHEGGEEEGGEDEGEALKLGWGVGWGRRGGGGAAVGDGVWVGAGWCGNR